MNEQISKAASLRASGLAIDEIARVMRVHRRTVFKWLEIAGPVAVENPTPPVNRTRAAMQEAMLDLIGTGIDRLRSLNPSPLQIATVVSRLSRALNALPAPGDVPADARKSMEEFRAELAEKLKKLNGEAPPLSNGE